MPDKTNHRRRHQATLKARIALCMRMLCRHSNTLSPQTTRLYHAMLRTEHQLKLLQLEESVSGVRNKEQGVKTVESDEFEVESS